MRNQHVNLQLHLSQDAVIYLSPEAPMVVSRQKKKIKALQHEFANHN